MASLLLLESMMLVTSLMFPVDVLVFHCCWRPCSCGISCCCCCTFSNIACLLLLASLQLLCHCFCCVIAVVGIPAVTVFLVLLAFLMLLAFLLLVAFLLLLALMLLLASLLMMVSVPLLVFLLLYDDLSLPHYPLYWRSCDDLKGLESSSDFSIQWRVTPAGVCRYLKERHNDIFSWMNHLKS